MPDFMLLSTPTGKPGCISSIPPNLTSSYSFGTINICPGFFKAKLTGTDSQGGTLVHESSHFTAHGGSTDIVYGQSGAKSLAKSNPAQAVMNADSHEYFAENNPSQS
jgi:peptidyl-Lys metalloendopeptidase